MRVLATRHIQDFLIIHQFAQRNVVEETGQTIAQIAPQRVGQAFIAALATAFALATGRIYRLVHSADYFTYCDAAGIFTQQIPAAWSTYAGNQTVFTQTGKQLLQI